MNYPPMTRAFLYVAVALHSLAACAPDPTGTLPRLEISIQPAAATLMQGDSTDIVATIRSSFSLLNVTEIFVTRSPTGVSTRVLTVDQGTTIAVATLRVTAGPTVTPGTYDLEVHASNSARQSPAGILSLTVLRQPACTAGDPCIQWAERATASSEYTFGDWSARQATGAPNVTGCVDDVKSWASLGLDTPQWLELEYRERMVPLEIRIHENYGASSITSVEVKDDLGAYHRVYTGAPALLSCPHVRIIAVAGFPSGVRTIRVHLDQKMINDWNEIDAVSLKGYRPIP